MDKESVVLIQWNNYSVIKDNEILKVVGKWMELEKIILSEETQTYQDKHSMYSFINRH